MADPLSELRIIAERGGITVTDDDLEVLARSSANHRAMQARLQDDLDLDEEPSGVFGTPAGLADL